MVVKGKSIRWAGHVALMRDEKCEKKFNLKTDKISSENEI
jgi:hypothetical protein